MSDSDQHRVAEIGRTNAPTVSKKSVDDVCLECFGLLFSSGRMMWQSHIIFKLKDIFDSQHYYISKYGLGHITTLSTPILNRFVRELIMNGFDYHTQSMLFDLEIHLRCIVAALRLLSVHGIRPGTGTLTFQYFNELYNHMSKWYSFAMSENYKRTGPGKHKNYNNEFLVVYARDLISSITTDRTITAELGNRMIAAAKTLAHTYAKNILLAAQSLKQVIQFKDPPSSWHEQYRAMDELCISIRTLRQFRSPSNAEQTEEWAKDIGDILETAEESVINELTDILAQKIEKGLPMEGAREVRRRWVNEVINGGPIGRVNHDVYGILDLIKQHVSSIGSGKLNGKVAEASLLVVKNTPYKYLRCKAFEVLAALISKPNLGEAHIEDRVQQLFDGSGWSESKLKKVEEQWEATEIRNIQMESHFKKVQKKSRSLSSISLHETDVKTDVLTFAPIHQSVSKLQGLLREIQETLQSPIDAEPESISILPCDHFISLTAWKRIESENRRNQANCPICQVPVERVSEPLPMKSLKALINQTREESQSLNELLNWNEILSRSRVLPASQPVILQSIPRAQGTTRRYAPSRPQSSTSNRTLRTLAESEEGSAAWETYSSDERDSRPSAISESPVEDERGMAARLNYTDRTSQSLPSPARPNTYRTTGTSSTRQLSEAGAPAMVSPLFRNLLPSTRHSNPRVTSTRHPYQGSVMGASEDATLYAPSERSLELEPVGPGNHVNEVSPSSSSTVRPSPRSFSPILPIRGTSLSQPATVTPTDNQPLETAMPLQSVPPQESRTTGEPLRHSLSTHTSNPSDVNSLMNKLSKRLRVKGVTRQYPAAKRKGMHQATAISPTCRRIALMDKTDFQIFSIPNSADEIPPIVAEGRNNGQFRYPPYDWMKEYPAQERDFHPDYSRAAMSDSKLCISCVQNCIDIHETLTGRCLGSFQLPKALHCWTLVLAPDEKTLAVGTVHGEVLLYNLETVGKATAPVTIPAKVDGKSVSCIAFSAESRYISICNSANNIYTYLLLNDAEPSLISQYSRGLAETACRDPYYGVTSLSFSNDSKALLVLSDAVDAYPIIVKEITSLSTTPQTFPLFEAKYKYKNCVGAFSPISETALVITRSGTVKLINCSTTGNKPWTVHEAGLESLHVGGRQWRVCSLQFSKDGYRALAFDRKGKLLIIDFTMESPGETGGSIRTTR